ncbi:peptidylprolyl isomerase [Evansella cellulosilytica]|nr:peptidylprolyl isomerase [Evansella cellulosilytica]
MNETVADNEIEAIIHTNMGEIQIKLFPEHAPKTVENFVTLSEDGYYDGVIFHRVIDNFMIQGGDPTGTGAGGESAFGGTFEDEFSPALAHFRGALSMANIGEPNTNRSQFFIVQADNSEVEEYLDYLKGQGGVFPEEVVDFYTEVGGTPHLDNGHTVFGHVIGGMDIVDTIAGVPTGVNNRPLEDVIIEMIEINQ